MDVVHDERDTGTTRTAGAGTVEVLGGTPAAIAPRVGTGRAASVATYRPTTVGLPWWLPSRARTATAVLVAADGTVLVGYLLAQPIWWRTYVALWALTVVSFQTRGAYRPRLFLSMLDDLPALVRRAVPVIVVVGVVVARLRGAAAVNSFVVVAAVGLLGHLVARDVAYRVIRWARRSGHVGYRTLVIGGGEVAQRIVRTLDERRSHGLNVLGYLDSTPSALAGGSVGWVQLGTVDDLVMVVRRLQIEVLVVAYGLAADGDVAAILRGARDQRPTVFVVPRLFEVGGRWPLQDRIGAVPVVRLRPSQLGGVRWRVKRAFDVSAASLATLVLAPVLAAVALAVRCEGGPGVIFRQVRVGRDGQQFEVLKFRSMRPQDPGESDVRWSIAQDDRVGPVGRFIRRTSLDELPQLFNILRGDMTIVGPRPERPHFVEQFSGELPHYPHRHRVPVGLTGLAQVSGLRGDTSIDERARYDNYYIENWSLWLDVAVILRTVRQVLRGLGT